METNAQTFSEIIDSLKQLDPNLIKQRAGGRDRVNNQNLSFDYLEWHVVTDILDQHAPFWSSTIKSMEVIGDFLVTTVAVTIDGITREGVGTGSVASEMGIKKSEHDALKRAALKFGVGRQLYKKEQRELRRGGSQNQQPSRSESAPLGAPPSDPIAKNLAEMVTVKQLGMLKAVSREVGVEPDEVCVGVLKCKPSELTRRAASWLIDFIRSEEFKAGAKENVVQMPERADSPVSPKIAGGLLFQAGAVKQTPNGYVVSQKIVGKPTDFLISASGDGVGCSCGEFKTKVFIQKQMDYQCAHIVAAELFLTAMNGNQASA